MYYGNIETPEDAIRYAEDLYRNARHEMYAQWEVLQDAVDAFLEGRDTADAKTLARLKRKARNAARAHKNAKASADFHRAYLQGVRDLLDALT